MPRCDKRERCDGKRARSGTGGCSGKGSSLILGNTCGEVGDDDDADRAISNPERLPALLVVKLPL